jgi:hypothetical protein
MKFNQWTVALATAGVVSLASATAGESSPVNSLVSGVTLSGHVDTSAIWNFGTGTTVAKRFANTAPERQDGFNLNVVKLKLEKGLDEGTWSAGYNFETMYGTDAAVMPGRIANGDLAIKQAYVALRAPVGNGLDFKIGQFDPTIGYEVTDSYVNPNFSRSFGFNNLEPFGHQGVLATYQFTEWVGATAGVANGFGDTTGVTLAGNTPATRNTGINAKDAGESIKTYIGGLVFKAPENFGFLAGSSLYLGIVDRGFGGGVDDQINYYVGASLSTGVEGLTVGGSYDYVDNLNGVANQYGYAWALYASYQLNEQLKLSYRAELAGSSGGIHLPGALNDEQVFGNTLTLDYALWKNVISRLEYRLDSVVGGTPTLPGTTSRVFDGDKNDHSLTVNIVYLF